MRAKKLESVSLLNNSCQDAIVSIIYNISFVPRLTYLDVSGNNPLKMADYVENLSKMININASIEYLIIENVVSLADNLSHDFFKSLAENSTLKVLSLNNSKSYQLNNTTQFAQALAINAHKKGNLTELHIAGLLNTFNNLNTFASSMHYSNKIVEEWFGDITKANKMGGNDTVNYYLNNLEILDISKTIYVDTPGFSYDRYKKNIDKRLAAWTKLFQISKNLKHLNLSHSNLNVNFCEILRSLFEEGCVTGYNNYGIPDKTNNVIEYWNLSSNPIKKEGAKHLKEAIKLMSKLVTLDISNTKLGVSGAYSINDAIVASQSLKNVNMFANKIDVDGARSLAKAIENDGSLEVIDIGFNRIRDEGLRVILESLEKNKKIKMIGLKSNYLRDTSLELILSHFEGKKSGIKKILLRKNLFSDYVLNESSKRIEAIKETVYADIIHKFDYNTKDRLERSVWIHPTNGLADNLLYPQFYARLNGKRSDGKVGVVLNMRTRVNKGYPNKAKNHKFLFVEFAHPASVDLALMLSSTKCISVLGKTFRSFKAGSSTYYYHKNCKIKQSATNYTQRTGVSKVASMIKRGNARRGRGGRH